MAGPLFGLIFVRTGRADTAAAIVLTDAEATPPRIHTLARSKTGNLRMAFNLTLNLTEKLSRASPILENSPFAW